MTNTSNTSNRKLHRLWSIPLLPGGSYQLFVGIRDGQLNNVLFGAGMILAGAFAFRHNLTDISPKGLDPSYLGAGWLAVAIAGVVLILAGTVVKLTT